MKITIFILTLISVSFSLSSRSTIPYIEFFSCKYCCSTQTDVLATIMMNRDITKFSVVPPAARRTYIPFDPLPQQMVSSRRTTKPAKTRGNMPWSIRKREKKRASKELYCLHIHKHILAKNKYAQGFSPAVQPQVEWQRAQSRGAIGGTRGGGLVLGG